MWENIGATVHSNRAVPSNFSMSNENHVLHKEPGRVSEADGVFVCADHSGNVLFQALFLRKMCQFLQSTLVGLYQCSNTPSRCMLAPRERASKKLDNHFLICKSSFTWEWRVPCQVPKSSDLSRCGERELETQERKFREYACLENMACQA